MGLNIVLNEPEIPQNTGSIGRTCVALKASLHLIEPLGFSLSDKYLKRAGMDYWNDLDIHIHADWLTFCQNCQMANPWFFTTKAKRSLTTAKFLSDTWLVFGKETAGLPESLLERHPDRCLRIPMKDQARSLNLSVSVGIAAYEVMRQLEFPDLSVQDPGNRIFL